MIRGGSWNFDAACCRAANQEANPQSQRIANVGLRLARVPAGKELVKIHEPPKDSPLEAKGHGLKFDGKNDHVELTLLRKENLPITVEAYVTPTVITKSAQVVRLVGPFLVGLAQVDGHWEAVIVVETPAKLKDGRGFSAKSGKGTAIPATRVHLAAAYDGKEFSIYVNGKQYPGVAGPGGLNLQPPSMIGARRHGSGKIVAGFDGVIDQLRISGIARYDKDFTPAKRFESDKNTLALYQFGEGQGNVLKDSSGRGHDGKIVGAKWVNADGTPKKIGKEKANGFKNSLGMEFVLVPKGKSWLGGGGGKPGTKEVEILQDFYLGKYEVTQEEWEKVMGSNPSIFKAVPGVNKEDQKRFPVDNISWEDARAFAVKLNEKEKEAGWLYRLPTELEWEYACRGGPMKDKSESEFDYYFAQPTNTLSPDQANFGKRLNRTCKVGSYQPNRLGLFDMHGNVWEWCNDEISKGQKNPKAVSVRVHRGGSWLQGANSSRAASRYSYVPSKFNNRVGARLARVPVGKEIVKVIAPAEN